MHSQYLSRMYMITGSDLKSGKYLTQFPELKDYVTEETITRLKNDSDNVFLVFNGESVEAHNNLPYTAFLFLCVSFIKSALVYNYKQKIIDVVQDIFIILSQQEHITIADIKGVSDDLELKREVQQRELREDKSFIAAFTTKTKQ